MANRFQTTLQNFPQIVKYILVLLVVVFISYLFPNNTKFKYTFEKGQTWRFEDLVAPFDFAILKPTDELNQELERLKAQFNPYYEVNPEIARQAKQKFRENFFKELEIDKSSGVYVNVPGDPDKYLNYGLGLIDKMYDRGFIQLDSQHQIKGDKFVVNLRIGNTTYQRTLQSFVDLNKIEDLVTDSLFASRMKEAEFLIPVFQKLFTYNIFYSSDLSNKFLQAQIQSISPSYGLVKQDELIIKKDGIVTDEIFQKLLSYRAQYETEVTSKKSHWGVFIGYFLLTSLILGVFLLYLKYHAAKVFQSFSHLLFMLMWLVLYSYLVYAVEQNNSLSSYLIPFCIVPIVVKIFFNDKLALFTHIVIVLIASFLSSLGYEFTFLQILAGIVAILANIEVRNSTKFFTSMLFIFGAYALGYLGLSLIKEGSLATIYWSIYPWLFLNVLFTLLAYPLIPLLERLFGFTSSITLLELSDMNQPLLKDLSIKAPGTLQHSLQVANLSEAAADKIGADQLLVKVAALYHDIGKTLQPKYFIENLGGGESPHNQLNNFESTKVIIEHVTEGVKIAKKARLPEVLIDFIRTHHGTTRVEYFYRKQMQDFPDKEFDESLFRYPGPRPSTKEQTILMMADSIEAASKSLKSPTPDDIDQFVDKIVSGKITSGQFVNSELTFEELGICVFEFKKLLQSIYHVRIEYPEE
ncbi:MAG: putative nucleotidyltransferase with HDIG domain [Saprospiraceae bacterium]|jgi:putative nucleotidyltransferase with HDIG domain